MKTAKAVLFAGAIAFLALAITPTVSLAQGTHSPLAQATMVAQGTHPPLAQVAQGTHPPLAQGTTVAQGTHPPLAVA